MVYAAYICTEIMISQFAQMICFVFLHLVSFNLILFVSCKFLLLVEGHMIHIICTYNLRIDMYICRYIHLFENVGIRLATTYLDQK